MDLAYDRMLQRATEEAANIERPQVRTLGRIISQMESMNLTMRGIREQIREDIRAKRRYFREEQKILKKDSDNLDSVKSNILGSLRKGSVIAGALGAAQLSTGNVAGATQSFGLASLLMAPDIINFLTGSVVNALALKGLIGNRGVGATNVSGAVRGASRMKNPLLMTAMLAAGLLIPSLARANQSGDNRRRELATRVIEGEQTINKPDVTRFRNQLNRFDRILSGISLDRKKRSDSTVDMESLTDKDKKQLDVKMNDEEEDKKGFLEGLKNFFLPKKEEQKIDEDITKKENEQVSLQQGDTNISLGDTIEGDTTIGSDNFEVDNSTEIALRTSFVENSIFNDQISNIFESNEALATDLLPNLDIVQIGRQIKSEITNNVIDLSTTKEKKIPSGFVGESVNPSSVSVNTAFKTGGGIIDKFEAASSLRSYGAFT
jgi:hypothetical protein